MGSLPAPPGWTGDRPSSGPEAPTDGGRRYARFALFLGLCSLVAILPFGLLLGVPAAVAAVVTAALALARAPGQTGRRMAMAGLAAAGVGLLASAGWVVWAGLRLAPSVIEGAVRGPEAEDTPTALDDVSDAAPAPAADDDNPDGDDVLAPATAEAAEGGNTSEPVEPGADVAELQVTELGRVCAASTDLAMGFDSLWVVCTEDELVQRVDPATGEVQAVVSIGPAETRPRADLWQVAVAVDRIWLNDNDGRRVLALDPQANAIVAEFSFDVDIGGVAVGPDGLVWALGHPNVGVPEHEIFIVDPASGQTLAKVPVREEAQSVVFSQRGGWVTTQTTTELVDLVEGTVTVVTEGSGWDKDVAAGAVWLAAGPSGIVRIDEASLEIANDLVVKGAAMSVAASGDERLWISSAEEGQFSLMLADPHSQQVQAASPAIEGSMARGGLAAGDGVVYVATWMGELLTVREPDLP